MLNSRNEAPGALRLWHEELRRRHLGQDPSRSSSWRQDSLYRAACCEQQGFEALRDGLPSHARHWFQRSAEILAKARRAEQGAQ